MRSVFNITYGDGKTIIWVGERTSVKEELHQSQIVVIEQCQEGPGQRMNSLNHHLVTYREKWSRGRSSKTGRIIEAYRYRLKSGRDKPLSCIPGLILLYREIRKHNSNNDGVARVKM